MDKPGSAKNAAVGVVLFGVAAGMVGLSFAAVPLYRIFCQVTGFGGTTQVADSLTTPVGERIFKVRFNADVNRDLPWRFRPLTGEISLRAGAPGQAVYRAENLSGAPVTGTSTYNVTPLKAGAYFAKVQCFCFEEQRLAPGETADLGVSFFVDPDILEDRLLDDVKTITLSYTFFRARGGERQEAAARASAATGPAD